MSQESEQMKRLISVQTFPVDSSNEKQLLNGSSQPLPSIYTPTPALSLMVFARAARRVISSAQARKLTRYFY